MKKTIQLLTAAMFAATVFTACGESNDPNVNGPVLPDTTNQDTMNNIPPAGGMGPNTAPPDSTSMPVDSMKGTRGNSATDTSKPAN